MVCPIEVENWIKRSYSSESISKHFYTRVSGGYWQPSRTLSSQDWSGRIMSQTKPVSKASCSLIAVKLEGRRMRLKKIAVCAVWFMAPRGKERCSYCQGSGCLHNATFSSSSSTPPHPTPVCGSSSPWSWERQMLELGKQESCLRICSQLSPKGEQQEIAKAAAATLCFKVIEISTGL